MFVLILIYFCSVVVSRSLVEHQPHPFFLLLFILQSAISAAHYEYYDYYSRNCDIVNHNCIIFTQVHLITNKVNLINSTITNTKMCVSDFYLRHCVVTGNFHHHWSSLCAASVLCYRCCAVNSDVPIEIFEFFSCHLLLIYSSIIFAQDDVL